MKGYLGSPMRGIPDFNFPAIDAMAAALRADAHAVVSPAEHDREMGFDETANSLEGFDMVGAIFWDLKQIAQTECVWVLPGWETSSGCAVEMAMARFLQHPIFEVYIEDGAVAYYYIGDE